MSRVLVSANDGADARAGAGPIGKSRPFESKRGQGFTDCSAKSAIRCCAAVETLLRASTPQRLLSQQPRFGRASALSPVEPRVSREWS
jgi:hypothetical protein